VPLQGTLIGLLQEDENTSILKLEISLSLKANTWSSDLGMNRHEQVYRAIYFTFSYIFCIYSTPCATFMGGFTN